MNDEKPILYYHNILPNFAGKSDIAKGIKFLNINPKILVEAYSFCVRNKIDDSVLGLHIRKTDFGNTVNDEELFKIVSNSDRKFFVCSDDSDVNDRFSMLKNCSVYKKKTFPTKMIENGSWNQLTTDDQGRIYNFNINRSSDSVIEALIDLLILSKTTHILTSHSTFLKMSMIFKAVNYFKF